MTLLDANKQTCGGGWKHPYSYIFAVVSYVNSWLFFVMELSFLTAWSIFFSFSNESHPLRLNSLPFLESHFWKATSLNRGTNERDNCGRVCITLLSVMCLVTPQDSSNSPLMPVLICCLIALESGINCRGSLARKVSECLRYLLEFVVLAYITEGILLVLKEKGMSDYSTAPYFNIISFAIHCTYCTHRLEMYRHVIKSVLKFTFLVYTSEK